MESKPFPKGIAGSNPAAGVFSFFFNMIYFLVMFSKVLNLFRSFFYFMTKTLLLGIHDEDLIFFYRMHAIQKGYSVILATSPDHLLADAKKELVELYLFDLNFVNPCAQDISFAKNAYSIISEKQKKGVNKESIKIMGISASPTVVDLATKEKIPATEKKQFDIAHFLS